jgi:hypothetical protein
LSGEDQVTFLAQYIRRDFNESPLIRYVRERFQRHDDIKTSRREKLNAEYRPLQNQPRELCTEPPRWRHPIYIYSGDESDPLEVFSQPVIAAALSRE